MPSVSYAIFLKYSMFIKHLNINTYHCVNMGNIIKNNTATDTSSAHILCNKLYLI